MNETQMKTDTQSAIFRLEDARADAKTIDGKRLASVAERGSLRLLCSFPLPPNVQSPHDQDELYFVVRGQGVIFHDGKRDRFAAGDAIFIAAGTEHHFEDFSDDLAVWVAFYGPKGGERIASAA
jgi:mannose-6-phosphate isomerase-like protein (cupin superfamily)